MLFHLDIEYLRVCVCVFACEQITSRNGQNDPRKAKFQNRTDNGICTMFVLFCLIPDPQYEG